MQLVRDEGDELRIGGLPFGVGHGVAEEALEGVQIAPVPGYLNSMADGPLHSGRRGAEGLGYLGVEYLGDGVGVPYGPPEAPEAKCISRLSVNDS